MGQSLRVQNHSFSSLLNVTVNSDMIGKDIKCVYDNGTTATLIGRQKITAGIGTVLIITNLRYLHS